ncbi:unnamed protein product [Echinostoma caproni]|uniref:Protein SHQ1 homolog n=1 Tax=Echinostoma caproni TaxID=27848 RepID=A0A183B7Y1_9TREM|nr:unnamed protein product [Echinostoma caproni]
MLTPIFRLYQDETTLSVVIHAPMAKLAELEVCVEEQIFFFTAPPYYLKFELPGPVHTEEETYRMELIDGDIQVVLKKKEHCVFKDLDLIVKLINNANPANRSSRILVEEIGKADCDVVQKSDENLDWFAETKYDFDIDSSGNLGTSDEIVVLPPTYGFSGSKSGLFRVESDLTHVVDLPNPDHCKQEHRSKLRISAENRKFCPVHYLADLFEQDCWKSMLELRVPWHDTNGSNGPELTDEQRHRLITLSTRRLPLVSTDTRETVSLYLGLLDLLLAYTYDYRVREGEEMTESGWNIVKLSATLSWFEVR